MTNNIQMNEINYVCSYIIKRYVTYVHIRVKKYTYIKHTIGITIQIKIGQGISVIAMNNVDLK